ncbi:fumarylacetoacetate hydrolase family protein [Amorphus sp. 3PC139-8]|uniref:fumarylacetoacetate hydrolase family protein n=1 Tax=Amorphus sp. 3PC139-8 TaxID=2735676 RepID=UPI00345CFB50
MKLASILRPDGSAALAAVTMRGGQPEGFLDLTARLPGAPDLRALLARPDGLDAARAVVEPSVDYALADVQFLPVSPEPRKILCVGVNYSAHLLETGRPRPERPMIFVRFADSQVGHEAPLVRPSASEKFDFEGELAVVIGSPAHRLRPDQTPACVAGYAIYNDASVRDWQRHTSQFTPGKNFPGTGAFGPWMTTTDEMGAIGPQRLETRLNGAKMQDATLDDLVFDVPALIAYCSAFTRLDPGDVIVTGTPGGVGAFREPPVWLKPGDMVEVEIDGLGMLRNRVVAEVE